MTAYTGLENIGKPKAGETLVVAAFRSGGCRGGAGAKIRGAHAMGIAGSDEKCQYVEAAWF